MQFSVFILMIIITFIFLLSFVLKKSIHKVSDVCSIICCCVSDDASGIDTIDSTESMTSSMATVCRAGGSSVVNAAAGVISKVTIVLSGIAIDDDVAAADAGPVIVNVDVKACVIFSARGFVTVSPNVLLSWAFSCSTKLFLVEKTRSQASHRSIPSFSWRFM